MKFFQLKFLLVAFTLGWGSGLWAQAQETPTTFAEFSVWSQRMDMSRYVGKKYRLSVAIRAEPKKPEAFALAFIRNEYPESGLRNWTYMDNMTERPVRDTVWKTYVLEYKVTKKSPWVGFGVLGFGNGAFYFDDLKLMVETSAGKWTEIPVPNGDFELEGLMPWEQTSLGIPMKVIGAKAVTDTRNPFEGKRCMRIENHFLKE